MLTKEALLYRGSSLIRKSAYNLYIFPHPILRPYISNYTISFPEPGMVRGTLTILPDASGCFVSTFDGTDIGTTCWGATTKPNQVDDSSNDCSLMVFIEFNPYGMYQFIRVDQAELADRIIDLESVDREIQSAIQNAVEISTGVTDLADCLDRFFLNRMIQNQPPAYIFNCLELIRSNKGQLKVKDISTYENYSERHLNRLFLKQIGIHPKMFLRLVRMNHAVRLLQKAHASLMSVALHSGYFDEPHLINEFKDLFGIPLHYYLQNMSDFYNETLKL